MAPYVVAKTIITKFKKCQIWKIMSQKLLKVLSKKNEKKEKKEKEVGKSFLTKILFYFAFDKLFIRGKF